VKWRELLLLLRLLLCRRRCWRRRLLSTEGTGAGGRGQAGVSTGRTEKKRAKTEA